MSDATQINTELNASETQINTEISFDNIRDDSTEINPELRGEGEELITDEIIGDRYVVEEPLDVKSGEADLYICSRIDEKDSGKKYVAKMYRRETAIKQEIIEKLLSIDSPYVAKLYDTFEHKGFTVDIIPYFKNGSLQGRKYGKEELLETIIPDINEGLKAIHDANIIHRDLKPSNIMLRDDGKHVSIIDFGISSAAEDGNTVIITRTGMTPEYSAPETFKNVWLRESDYYSFGITLFELFCGYVPYANLNSEEIEQYLSVQSLTYPEDMPDILRDFISALTYKDISNRHNKNNPNRRWTYDEVNRWLDGEDLVIPGEGIGNVGLGAMPPYQFMTETFTDEVKLVEALTKHWDEGKKHLFRGYLQKHFRGYNTELERACRDAEKELNSTNGKEDLIFWKTLYKINPKLKGLYWMGKTYESLPAFGSEVLEKLWNKDASDFQYYNSVLNERILTEYVQMVSSDNEKVLSITRGLEDLYQIEETEHRRHLRTYYRMAYQLSGQKLFYYRGNKFRTTGELAKYLESVLAQSKDDFRAICHEFIDQYGNLDLQLETWLIAIGKENELRSWIQFIR